MKKNIPRLKNNFRKSERLLRSGMFALGFAAMALTWSLQAENQKAPGLSLDERNQFSEAAGPEVYNASAYKQMQKEIAASISDDALLSDNARNVEISVRNGTVTVRGKVNSVSEQSRILAYAKESAGLAPIKNQLKVTTVQ